VAGLAAGHAGASVPDVSKETLSALRRRYVGAKKSLPVTKEQALRADERTQARAIVAAVERRRRANRSEGQRLRHLSRFEVELYASGIQRVAGVDEAGMSPLAGPVAAAAVILKPGWRARGIDDSKKVDPETRLELAQTIKENAIAFAVAFVEPDHIDRINIYWAGLLAMLRAVEALSPEPEQLLVDARKIPFCKTPQRSLVHGDARSISIAAASILAKTARDARMLKLDEAYPGYGFAQHKGYPVKSHVAALMRLGPCPMHRRSFGPVAASLGITTTEPNQAGTELAGAKPST
jgi:ribonuclease HII